MSIANDEAFLIMCCLPQHRDQTPEAACLRVNGCCYWRQGRRRSITYYYTYCYLVMFIDLGWEALAFCPARLLKLCGIHCKRCIYEYLVQQQISFLREENCFYNKTRRLPCQRSQRSGLARVMSFDQNSTRTVTAR